MRQLALAAFAFAVISIYRVPSVEASSITCGVASGSSTQTTTGALSCAAGVSVPQSQTVTNVVTVPLSATTSVDLFDVFTQTGLSVASASGTLGTLHGFASSTMTNGPAGYSYTSDYLDLDENGQPVLDAHGDPTYIHFATTDKNPMLSLTGGASSNSEWTDAIHVRNPGAAAGSLVTVLISAPMSAGLSSTDCGAGDASALNFFFVNKAATVNGVTFGTDLVSAVGTRFSACNPGDDFSTSATFTVPVDSFLFLDGLLRVGVGGARGDALSFLAIADASQTGHAYFDVLTPGAFYVDENGSVNPFLKPTTSDPGPGGGATAVPEPATLGLVSIGLASAAMARRRRLTPRSAR